MHTKLILNSISRHISLNEKETGLFISLLSQKRLRRREFLLQSGEVCRHAAFVNSGCLRSYSIDENGFEHILQFAPSGWWITDMYSLLTQKPGNLFIEAAEDTDALMLSRADQERLFRLVPKFERFFRIITENSLVASRERVLDNLSLTALQRYEKFCSVYPSIIDSVQQKHVASYIGVTPEFLSKLKKQRRAKNSSAKNKKD